MRAKNLQARFETEGVSRWTVVRDLLIFQLKLGLDGLVDLILSPLAVAAAAIEIFFGGERRGRLFYAILRMGERVDLWLNLYGASQRANREGLFGGSKAGSPTFIGQLEQTVRGGDEPRGRRR